MVPTAGSTDDPTLLRAAMLVAAPSMAATLVAVTSCAAQISIRLNHLNNKYRVARRWVKSSYLDYYYYYYYYC